MTHIVADRVKETTTTTGTGALSLSAATGFRRFSEVCATSDTVFYAIAGGSEWEVGYGTYSGTNQLTRTTVIASSNSGVAVSLSAGTKDVFLTDPATAQVGQVRPKRSGATYYDVPGVPLTGQGATTHEGGYIHYQPFPVRGAPIAITELAFRVVTAASSGNTARVAIYRSDTYAQPGALVAGATGIAITTTGKKTASVSAFLLPGLYLLAFWSTANVEVKRRLGPSWQRTDLDEYDLIRSMKVYRDPTANTSWADPGTAWTDAENTNDGFYHTVFCAIG